MIHLDTSFVIDLLRENAKKHHGPAHQFIDAVSAQPVGVSVFVACELFMGAELSAKPAREMERVRLLCEHLHIDYPDTRFAPAFAKHYARQETAGQRISTMDLLIATSAILSDAPLVTRNTKDFARISGLKLMTY